MTICRKKWLLAHRNLLQVRKGHKNVRLNCIGAGQRFKLHRQFSSGHWNQSNESYSWVKLTVWAVQFDQTEKWIPFSYDDLRELIFHEIAWQNHEILWCWDGQKLEQLFNFEVLKFANFIPKDWEKKAWLDRRLIILNFFRSLQHYIVCICHWFINIVCCEDLILYFWNSTLFCHL